MPEAEIRNDRHGIPHHAYKQADGNYRMCSRKAGLCKDCTEYKVPIIPADPFEVHCDLFRAKSHLPWQARLWTVPVQEEAGILKPTRGAHIIAFDRETKDRTILGYFGADEAVMPTLLALCAVHNEMLGDRAREAA